MNTARRKLITPLIFCILASILSVYLSIQTNGHYRFDLLQGICAISLLILFARFIGIYKKKTDQ